MTDIFKTKLTYLPGVGPKRAEVLARDLDLVTYLDLLHYFPYKYIDRTQIYRVRDIRVDMPYIQLRGYIRDWKEVGEGRKRRLVGIFTDGTGTLELLWFRSFAVIERMYELGREYVIFGKPQYFNGTFSIAHPEIDDEAKLAGITGGLMPVYNTSEKMKSSGLTNRQMRQMLLTLVRLLSPYITETMPSWILSRTSLLSYREAIEQIHFPTNTQLLEEARRRLKFEELFFIQLKLQSLRLERRVAYQGYRMERVGELFHRLYGECLPFDLTGAQKRVVREIRADMGSGVQMNRLVQGDVGSGKTLVALMSMLIALDNGYQACMMAPTEILARQHHAGLSELVAPLGIEVGLLLGSTTKKQRTRLLSRLASGELRMIVGTHALLEPVVQFHRLGIAVIDEQHRFGVEQRARLWSKNAGNTLPHILIMSATPIPRTLAMTLYGDLDISVIDELPPGRKPIQTVHSFEEKMYTVYKFIRSQVDEGRQVYVVFPMIEESERDDMRNLEQGYQRYREAFPDYHIVVVHGKMKAKEKDEHMQRFVSGEAQLLLATTVIEVGVNVPNASVMVIEGANRFGLSQLHQLRGRVGRGAAQSYCILVTGYELGEDAKRRVQIMVETNDGFEIAEQDLRLRGFGDLEGTQQSGQQLSLRIANPARDGEMVQYTRELAEELLTADPQLSHPDHDILRRRMQELYSRETNWGVIS